IGYGGDEQLIKNKIAEAEMQDRVVILGKKENPYPYIKACDIYVQPSKYEGKSVSVREAQILNKPVIITAYATSGSQLKDGFDGIIVPMDNEGCAEGIARVIENKELQQRLIENTKACDYTNAQEISKIHVFFKSNEL
ncbi:MAG: glycosyltransferase, partial [Clostridia bacterium]|nr:glycosyltransferase [Clostridia bacterium]